MTPMAYHTMQWACTGKISLVGTLAWQYGHIYPFVINLLVIMRGARMNGHLSMVKNPSSNMEV